jgi:hypothetical protein
VVSLIFIPTAPQALFIFAFFGFSGRVVTDDPFLVTIPTLKTAENHATTGFFLKISSDSFRT